MYTTKLNSSQPKEENNKKNTTQPWLLAQRTSPTLDLNLSSLGSNSHTTLQIYVKNHKRKKRNVMMKFEMKEKMMMFLT